MAYSISTGAALTGFRVIRERPRVLAFWTLMQLAMLLLNAAVTTTFGGAALTRFQALMFRSDATPAQLVPLIRQLAPMSALVVAIALVFYPLIYAAMNRAVLRPERDRLGYLGLGLDELRQLGLIVLLILAGFGFCFLLALAIMVVAQVSALVTGAGGAPQAAGGPADLLMLIGLFGGLVYFGVRLSLASPLTFATGRINLFGSWALTRGRFWPLFRTYAFASAMSALVTLLGLAVILPVTTIIAGGYDKLLAALSPQPDALIGLLAPVALLYMALTAVLRALIMPLTLTPAVAIYRDLATANGLPGGDEPTTASLFS